MAGDARYLDCIDGGGWQFRLCPAGSTLDEECFQKTPVPFARNSAMMMSSKYIHINTYHR